MAVTFTIRSPKPEEKRAGFSILKTRRVGRKRFTESVKSEDLKIINANLKAGKIKFDEAKALVEDLRGRLDRKENGHRSKPLTHSENLKLLEAYWAEDYQYRDVVDKDSMRNSLVLALRTLGDVPLFTAEPNDIYKAISKSAASKNQERRIYSRLNQLLRFAGRNVKLKIPRKARSRVKFLTETEVIQLAEHLGGTDKLLVLIAFATGCRSAEIFSLTESSLRQKNQLYVDSQMRRNLQISETKTRRYRNIIVLKCGAKALKTWVATSISEREVLRNRRYSDVIRDAAKELWPKNKEKHITFHDLRHSYAIDLVRRGVSITQISLLLGNSVSVCQEYYTGFAATDETLEAIQSKISPP